MPTPPRRIPKGPSAEQLTLVDLGAPTPERARELCDKIPIGARLAQEWKGCGKKCCARRDTHGPYWYAFFTHPTTRKTVRRYVGSQEKLGELLQAWKLVRDERRAAGRPVDEPRKIGRLRRRASPHDPAVNKKTRRAERPARRGAPWRDHAAAETGESKKSAGTAGE